MKQTLYRVDRILDAFAIKKFDSDFNLLSEYVINGRQCLCPQGINRKAYCRHLEMIDGPFSNHHHVGDGWFYCYETGAWHEPALSDPA